MRSLAVVLAFTIAVLAHAQRFEEATFTPSSINSPSAAGCRGGPGTNDPSLYTCVNLSLADWVMAAYKIPSYQYLGPEWTMKARFNLNARVPEGATKDELAEMILNLLSERMHLSVHHELREIESYDLAIANGGPKLKRVEEAAPEPALSWKPADKDGPVSMESVRGKTRMSWRGVTMPVLAKQLGGQARRPVNDATGLGGRYDVDLSWDTETKPTFFDALEDQLGLRLEPKMRPLEFIVVDRADSVPVEN
jgi:uncharacterized protein (TIGR03435 family)